MHKLDSRGHAHWLFPVIAILIVGGIGAYVAQRSRAAVNTTNVVSSADSYVSSGNPNTNYGTVNALYTKSSGPNQISYLSFNLTNIVASDVQLAKLNLRVTNNTNNKQTIKIVTSAWQEKTVTYNNRPSTGETITTLGTLGSGNQSIDLTSFVKANAGKTITLAIESSGKDNLALRSREATNLGNRPHLAITQGSSSTDPETTTDGDGGTTTPPPTTGFTPLKQNTAWQWQLTGTVNETVLDTSTNPNKMYDIDMFNASPELISRLKNKGIYVVCYVEAGDWASGRPDAGDFATSILGRNISGFPDEKFINVKALDSPAGPTGKTLRQIMTARLQLAQSKGCQGIEPDLDDLHTYSTGFTISQSDMVTYNKFLIDTGHSLGMSVGLKNGADEGGPGSFTAAMYNAGADWVLNEECNQYSECSGYNIFIQGGRPVFQVEYLDNQRVSYSGASGTCTKNNAAGFDGIVKDSSSTLAALPRIACRSGN